MLLTLLLGILTELIISVIALIKNEIEVALASIISSMLANLLLLLGLSMIVGGTKYSEQKIGYQATQSNITLLTIILIYLTIPSIIPLAPNIYFIFPTSLKN